MLYLAQERWNQKMDNLGIVLMLAGFVLSFCCAVNAIRGKPSKKIWYSMIAAYISFGICYAISERDARNIGIAFMLICFCYIVKVVWGFLKAAIKHEKYHFKKDLLVLIAVFVLFIVGMMLPYDKAAAAQRAAESEAREIEKAASSAAAASSKAEAERQKQAESEAAASNKSASKPKKSSSSSSAKSVTTLDFDAVYKEYKSNEVRAEETYGDKRYRVTGTVNGLTDSGLANLFGGTTVTLVRQVGNTTVYFFASFPKDQKDAIMKINTGDEITFVGEYSKMSFYSCELESYTRSGKTTTVK